MTLAVRHVGVIHQRQLHVLQCRSARQEVVGLKHKANLSVADVRQFVFAPLPDRDAINEILARSRLVEATKDVEQGRLAATRRAHDAHELALTNVERHAFKRVNFLTANDKRPLEVLNLDDGLPFAHDHF